MTQPIQQDTSDTEGQEHTELCKVGPWLGCRSWAWLGKGPARRHQVSSADLAVLRIASRCCHARSVFGRWHRRAFRVIARTARSRRGAARSHAHAAHTLTQLKLLELLLKEFEVPLAFAHLVVELGPDLVIVCLLAHEIGGLDQRLLAFNLFVDVHHLVFFAAHGGGVRPARTGAQRGV